MPEPEGMTLDFKGQEAIRSDLLEAIPFEGRQQYIRSETEEFIAVCPFSGLPDVGRLVIEYYPRGGKCVELKSLKYYVTSFKDVGIYQEEATLRIYRDLQRLLETDSLRVSTEYNIRGGFKTTAVQGEL